MELSYENKSENAIKLVKNAKNHKSYIHRHISKSGGLPLAWSNHGFRLGSVKSKQLMKNDNKFPSEKFATYRLIFGIFEQIIVFRVHSRRGFGISIVEYLVLVTKNVIVNVVLFRSLRNLQKKNEKLKLLNRDRDHFFFKLHMTC